MRRRLLAMPALAMLVALSALAADNTGVVQLPPAPADTAPPPGSRAAPAELPAVIINASGPDATSGAAADSYPADAQFLSAGRVRAGTQNIAGALDAAINGISINDTQGNGFEADVNYRGFTASPVLGTPQGISVYLDGMRLNEPFGDVVAWDLVPMIAVANVAVLPGANPAYGLNTLGGAVVINTKTGSTFPGAAVTVSAGSHALRAIDAQAGSHGDRSDVYVAASLGDDPGWARGGASIVERWFARVGVHGGPADMDISLQHADNRLGGAQLVAQSMLSNAALGYSHPDVTQTRSDALNLVLRRELGDRDSVTGNIHVRNIQRDIVNSNIVHPVDPGAPGQDAACRATDGSACASNVVSGYTQEIGGVDAQYEGRGSLGGLPQEFAAGVNGEFGSTGFTQSAQDAVVDAGLDTVGIGRFAPQSRIGASNLGLGLYAMDTLAPGQATRLMLAVRLDRSRVGLTGSSVDDFGQPVRVDGSHAYQHLNPSLGGTIATTPSTTLFANVGAGFRAPSAIELACADPAHPCAGVPSAFSADPPLRGVTARSLEAGARGAWRAEGHWRLALFRTVLGDDILFHQSSLSTGYFSNVGTTRRQGAELAFDDRHRALDYSVAATLLDATYRSTFLVADGANAGAACPGSACVPVRPGDRIPGIPRIDVKIAAGYQASDRVRAQLQAQARGPVYARGDENNLATQGRIPGYLSANADVDWKIGARWRLDFSVDNLFDHRYATFGMLAANNLRGGAPDNFWAVAAPRSVLLSLKALL